MTNTKLEQAAKTILSPTNEATKIERFKRMDGLVNTKAYTAIVKAMDVIVGDLSEEEFDKDDISLYFSSLVLAAIKKGM